MNYYARAIQILADNGTGSAMDLLYKIAATNPGAIVRAVDGKKRYVSPEEKASTALKDRCRSLLAAGEKISAIKLWRVTTDAGLKEAKEAVEAL